MITMKKLSLYILSWTAILSCLVSLSSCDSSIKETHRGTPMLCPDDPKPEYVEDAQTFNLELTSDSCEGAKVTFYLLDGDSVLMKNETGLFTGIVPLDEGYNVYLTAEWKDTTIITPTKRVFGFIVPREPVEPMAKVELQRLINAKDKSIKLSENEHLAQAVAVKTLESQYPVTTLFEAVERLEQGMWASVEVKDVAYDDNHLITEITLKPKEVVLDPEIYEDEEEYYE